MKLKVTEAGYARFKCPGCKCTHAISVKPMAASGWEYNQNPDAPTVTPSVLVRSGHYCDNTPQPPNCRYCELRNAGDSFYQCYRCHSFITDGMIKFLDDCTHELKGQTVPLPDWIDA